MGQPLGRRPVVAGQRGQYLLAEIPLAGGEFAEEGAIERRLAVCRAQSEGEIEAGDRGEVEPVRQGRWPAIW